MVINVASSSQPAKNMKYTIIQYESLAYIFFLHPHINSFNPPTLDKLFPISFKDSANEFFFTQKFDPTKKEISAQKVFSTQKIFGPKIISTRNFFQHFFLPSFL